MAAEPLAVFARLRPGRDDAGAASAAVTVDQPRTLQVRSQANGGTTHTFTFSRVFDADASQEEVYANVLKPLIDEFLGGKSVTALAYGQTSSGKTFSMIGGAKYKQRGMIPRAISDVFAALDREDAEQAATAAAAAEGAGVDAGATASAAPPKLFASYLQIYNESLYDLLEERHGDRPIEAWETVRLREGRGGALLLSNLRQFEVAAERDVLNLLFLGNVRRMVRSSSVCGCKGLGLARCCERSRFLARVHLS